MNTTIRLDTKAEEFLSDPYPSYAEMRERCPVLHDPELDVWMVFRHDHCAAVLRHPEASVAMSRAMQLRPAQQPVRMAYMREAMHGKPFPRTSHSIYQSDPPHHTRLRALLGSAFAVAGLDRLRTHIERRTTELLDAVDGRPSFDLMADLAVPLHTSVIDELVGFPHDPHHETLVRRLSHLAVKMADPATDAAGLRAGFEATAALEAHCAELIARKRSGALPPGPDIVCSLLAAQAGDPSFTADELLDQVVLVYLAGLESTANLLGNGLHALFDHPDQLGRLHGAPALASAAVDEIVRYDSPVQFTRRIPTAALEIGGSVIPAGALVLVWLGSANRDPDRWGADAHALKVDRPGAGAALSFGGGIHLCLGAPLSRIEGQVALPALLARFPSLCRGGPTRWNDRVMLRGVASLPVLTDG